MALFPRAAGRWSGRNRAPSVSYPDPNDPTSPDFAERCRATVTTTVGGFQRVDYGEPIQSLPDEVQEALVENREVRETLPEVISDMTTPAAPTRPFRDPREFKPGLGRG